MRKLRPPATSGLTKRQREVVDAIARLTKMNRRPPTFRDVMAAIGVSSVNGAQCHITALRKKGFVAGENSKRGIVLVGFPCCGRPDE